MTDRFPLLWLDLETTGLDADCRIIEIAACLTEPDWPFKRLDDAPFISLVDPASVGGSYSVADHVVRMHAINGLWRELAENNPPSLVAVSGAFLAWLGRHLRGSKCTLAGNGVARFDYRVLERWMPAVARRLTYYTMDIGVLRRWQEAVGHPLPVEDPLHRAWADVTDALEMAHALGAPKPPQTFVCSVCFEPISSDLMQVTGSRTSHYPACPEPSASMP